MNVMIVHNDGEDFGSVRFELDRDDTVSVELDGSRSSSITFGLFNHEAAALIEALRPIADAPDL